MCARALCELKTSLLSLFAEMQVGDVLHDPRRASGVGIHVTGLNLYDPPMRIDIIISIIDCHDFRLKLHKDRQLHALIEGSFIHIKL